MLPMIELLEYYFLSERANVLKTLKYGKKYLELPCEEIDSLIKWVQEMRELGGSFTTSIIAKMTENSNGKAISHSLHCQ